MISVPFCPLSRYKSTVSVVPACFGRVIGSETMRLPTGTRIEVSPSKDNGVVVPGIMDALPRVLLAGTEMATEVMGRSVLPKALERRRRMVWAGWVRRSV